MPHRNISWTTILVVLVAALGVMLSACGDEGSQDTAAPPGESGEQATETDALEERIAQLEAELDGKKRKEARAKKRRERERREARTAETEPAPDAAAGGGIIVPDVAGLDHQAAQDALQGEGLWLLDEADATGQGRLLLFDRNWEVVRTDPPAGSEVSAETTITIYSKKQGE